ncbi:MAG: hypothetical protein DRJ66_03095 [Thermoprotei archaeon]|nr:MAG: hypothetical protein DRJ66_03095 [Thermoprotei archaeon]RLF19814.1 MAG: hypothetical protein DRZ82_04270 [Thermoprotei archaeon]
MKVPLVIDKIEKNPNIPRLLTLSAHHRDETLKVTMDLPEKLQEVVEFNQGEEVELELSKDKIENVKGKDLYMHGYVLFKGKENDITKLQISIHGLMLTIETKSSDYSRELNEFSNFEKVYILFRRK